MGVYFFDQYSLLHFSTGVIAYFFGFKLKNWMIIHILFELIENTEFGVKFIDTYLHNIWPGGKEKPDSFVNSMLGDNFFAFIGWICAYYLEDLMRLKPHYALV
jgi:hypothetical protein